MKGPGLKTGNDVRRLWRCPTSGKELLVKGNVTSVRSPFVNDPTWMKLVEEFKPPREMVLVEKFHHLEEVAADAVFEGETPPVEKAESPSEESVETEKTKPAADSDQSDTEPKVEKKPEDNFGDGLDAEDPSDESL